MDARRILIVGGGSAGWMCAAYLDAALNFEGERSADITLVESPDVPRIGVGEATIPNINHILAVIGIRESDFLRRVDGTFKQSIRYVDWLHGRGEYYHHPFSRYKPTPLDRSGPNWLQSDRSIPFTETVSPQAIICELGLAPRMLGEWDFGRPLTYAYHMNAQKFADYLCEIATARGVTHRREHVVDVEMADNGDIAAIRTRDGARLAADLFIDCTGFAALLIGKALGVGWVDCSQWLLCDRATVMQVPYEQHYPGYVRPYTTATALSAGWVWEIPLQDKRSLGYVHSGSFLDDDAAERELRAFEGAHAEHLETRIVPFSVGHREKAWARNCIAIGLAGSFIEPLESTGLYLSDLATVMLAEHFPYRGDMAPLAYRFNRILANRYYEILDFINLHYCLTRRTDSAFWREVQKPARVHERLQAKLDYWRIKPPSAADFEDMHLPGQPDAPLPSGNLPGDHRSPVDTAGLWGYESYEAILYGMQFLDRECDAWYGRQRPAPRVLRRVIEKLRQAPSKLPRHDAWLQRVLGMPVYPPPADD
ncbi:MAG TPA: tryptophan halogenase family protein [Woeseiaceae bacterium]|nr:tryptophan halogenase family protein [Woeseiaceae bacterium]